MAAFKTESTKNVNVTKSRVKFKRSSPTNLIQVSYYKESHTPGKIGLWLHCGKLPKMAQQLLLVFSSKPVLERHKERLDIQD